MRMPQYKPPPLPEYLEAIRAEINALADDERRALMGRLWGDTVRRNDANDQARYEQAERERNRKRPDSRQMRMPGVAA